MSASPSEKPKPVVYQLILVAMPDAVDHNSRMKRLLKMALRAFRFRCIDVREIEDAQAQLGRK